MASIPWEMEDGLRLVRALSEEVEKFGYQVTLGGSVLHKGKSESDIDIYLLPLERGKASHQDGLYEWLKKMWGEPDNIPEWIDEAPQDPLGAPPNIGPEVAQPDPNAGAWRVMVGAGLAGANAQAAPRARGVVRAQAARAPLPEDIYGAPAKKEKKTSFTAKWRFYRNSDRVDIFVVG